MIAGARRFFAVLRRLRCFVPLWLASLVFLWPLNPFWLSLAHSQDTQSSAGLARVRGIVINSVTGEPVVRALVSSPDHRFAMFTDDQGRFEFQVPQTGSSTKNFTMMPGANRGAFQFEARKPGFLESARAVYFQVPSSGTDDLTLTLVPESLIVGRVNLPSSNQSDRISVHVYRREVREGRPFWTLISSVSTRSNGEFRVANLAAGSYKVFTEEMLDHDPLTFDPRGPVQGYPPIYYPAASDFASASAITLDTGKIFQVELSPVLQPYYQVKIALPNAEAPSGVDVSVSPDGHKGPGYSLGYGGDQAIGGMLPSGSYVVEATVQQGQRISYGASSITVKGAPVMHASMAVLPNGSIPVNIKEELTGKTSPSGGFMRIGTASRELKADVSLQPADDFDTNFATLRPPRMANDNDLVLDNVRPGRYWLQVTPVGSRYVVSAAAGGVDLLHQPLVVGPGGASPPIDIVLRDDPAAIDGTVDGMPAATPGFPPAIPMASVYCIPSSDSTGHFAEAGISGEGTFQFRDLSPGTYRVLAFDRPQGELEYRNAEAMEVYEGKGPVIRLLPGQTDQVRIPLIVTKE